MKDPIGGVIICVQGQNKLSSNTTPISYNFSGLMTWIRKPKRVTLLGIDKARGSRNGRMGPER